MTSSEEPNAWPMFDDHITKERRRKPGRNLTNDITNGVLAFIVLGMVIGGLLYA